MSKKKHDIEKLLTGENHAFKCLRNKQPTLQEYQKSNELLRREKTGYVPL